MGLEKRILGESDRYQEAQPCKGAVGIAVLVWSERRKGRDREERKSEQIVKSPG